jgi:hypothetical protein
MVKLPRPSRRTERPAYELLCISENDYTLSRAITVIDGSAEQRLKLDFRPRYPRADVGWIE